MKNKLLALSSCAALVLATVTAGSAADASPPPVETIPPVATTPVVGTLEGRTRAQQDGVTLHVRRDTTVRTFSLTYPVGSISGWHRHPGVVLAVVQSGSVVRQVGCRSETFTPGMAFTEVAPHQVSNTYRDTDEPGAVPAVLSITQLYPEDAPRNRVDVRPPRCS